MCRIAHQAPSLGWRSQASRAVGTALLGLKPRFRLRPHPLHEADAYGRPCAWPGSSRRPRPGSPATLLTAGAVVGPTQKSAANVGVD